MKNKNKLLDSFYDNDYHLHIINNQQPNTMCYYIYASIYDGTPSLTICNADSGETVLNWQYQAKQNIPPQQIQQLFRRLILLTCQQDMDNVRIFECRQQSAHH